MLPISELSLTLIVLVMYGAGFALGLIFGRLPHAPSARQRQRARLRAVARHPSSQRAPTTPAPLTDEELTDLVAEMNRARPEDVR